MAKKRKGISKKLRMEVFKRDSFTCQYCGKSAPTVILHIDHIQPHSKGGTDEIMNLITSCVDCNLGKGNRELSDDTAVKKVQRQAELLNERRQQMEMMMAWHEELKDLSQVETEKVAEYWASSVPGLVVTDQGKKSLMKLLRKYGLTKLLKAIDTAVEQYIHFNEEQNVIQESAELAFQKIGGILRVEEKTKEKPYLPKLYYIRGILRKRLSYVNEYHVMDLLENAVQAGLSIDEMERQAKRCSSWTNFKEPIEDAIYEMNKEEHDHVLEDNESGDVVSSNRELDERTELIGAATYLATILQEDYGFTEEDGDEITSALGFLCSAYEKYLIEYDVEKTVEAVNEALREFIIIRCCGGVTSRVEEKYRPFHSSFQELNAYLFSNLKWDIPFVYCHGPRVTNVVFPTQDMYVQGCQHLTTLDGKISGQNAYNLIQTEFYDRYTAEWLVEKAVSSALNYQLARCGLTPSVDDIRRLLLYFGRENVLDVVDVWIARWDEETGEKILAFDEDREFKWDDFLTELSVNYEPKLDVILAKDLVDYEKLFEGTNAYFRGFFEYNGIIRTEMFEGWNKFEEMRQVDKKHTPDDSK